MTRTRSVLAVLAVVVLAPAAWPYVNGGDFRTTVHDYENTMLAKGWAVCVGETLPGDRKHVARGFALDVGERVKDVAVDPDDNADFQRYCNRLVGRALRNLPEEKVDKIPLADRRAVARITRETLRDAVEGKGKNKKEGQIGSLKYQVGVYSYETWWETNYGREGRRIHERTTRWVAFVALKVAEEKR